MSRPPESMKDFIATLIQTGHVQQKTSDQVAEEIMAALEQEAELRGHDPRSEL